MHNKVIKKYQLGKNLYTSNFQNINSIVEETNKRLRSSTPGINIKPIGSALAEDATRQKRIADGVAKTTKATKSANFANTMGVASQLVDPILGMSEGIANSMGANIKQKDEISGGVDMLAPLADMAVPGLGTALKVLDFGDRALGKKTKGLNINAGSGFAGSNVNEVGKNFRLSQTGGANKWNQTLSQKGQMASKAKNLMDTTQFQQEANLASAGNVSTRNAMQLDNSFNKKILLSKEGSKLNKMKEFATKKKVSGIPHVKSIQELNSTVDDVQGSLTANKAKDWDSGGYKVSTKTGKVELAQHGTVVDGQETLGEKGMAINVIPDGALHARKHNMEDTNDEMTKKGIPVITIAEKGDVLDNETGEKAKGGEIIQHAEIEKEEVILHLGLTKQLEAYMKDGSDTAMIKAGELLAKELMENTQDNTDLTEKLIGNEN